MVTRSKSAKRKRRNITYNPISDLISKGKQIRTIREYSFDAQTPATRNRSRSLNRKLRSLNVSQSSLDVIKKPKSFSQKTRESKASKNSSKIERKNKVLVTSRSLLNSGGKQQSHQQFLFELQAKLDAQLIKNNEQKNTIRTLKKEKSELKIDLKRAYIGIKKMANLEKDYQLLMTSFEESAKLRSEQKIIIDNMRAEIKRLKQTGKKQAELVRNKAFV